MARFETTVDSARFERDGYLLLEDWFDPREAAELVRHATGLAERYQPGPAPTAFSTRTHAHASNRYFLDSGNAVHYFLEEEANTGDGAALNPGRPCLNKIGHALHRLDPCFCAFSTRPQVFELCRSLGLSKPAPIQSMVIFKHPRIGGEVVCHQDATFLHTEPLSVIGLWFALEPARRDNGCLWTIPGGHHAGLKRRFVREGDQVRFVELDHTPWPMERGIPIEAEPGSLVVLHGLLPHWSETNRSARSRMAFALHLIDEDCAYSPDNWLQPNSG